MLFSLAIPFVHISINVSDIQKLEHPFQEIGKFRSYYEQLIAMTDPEFITSRKEPNNLEFEEYNYNYTLKTKIEKGSTEIVDQNSSLRIQNTNRSKLSIAQVLFIIYTLGAIFFLTRILLLFRWIYNTIANNASSNKDKVKLIILNENLPPFSFLNYVFLNQEILISNKVDQILSHEEIHITQRHSLDLLFAHFITIFLWFNPIAWLLQKAIKTNHEYIADSEVVNNGCDLLDYQELLLNQFISIPSVQLVNNFNLISIKNRLAMMNKIKSGFTAKLKALLIIPAAILTFFLFSNLTLNGPDKVLKNFSFFENQNSTEQLMGLWKNNTKDTYGYLIKFTENKISILEDQVKLKEYEYSIKNNNIILNVPNGDPISLTYQIRSNTIKIWWNELNSSEFTKTSYTNSLDVFLADKNLKITPPTVKNYKILERLELCLFVALQENKVVVQDQVGEFDDLEKLILEEKSKFNQLDLNIITIQLAVDENTPMKKVYNLYQILRRNNLLKISIVCYPLEQSTNLIQPTTAFSHKLPPLVGIELIDKKDLPAMSIDYFEIDATNKENTVDKIEPKLIKFISESEKYIKCLIFNNSTTYKDYISYMDMVWTVLLDFRNQYSLEKYKIDYENLGKEFQLEVKKRYPIILTQVNIDEEEFE